ADRCIDLIKPRTIAVPERLPPDVALDPGRHRSTADVLLLDLLLVIGPIRCWVREQPALACLVVAFAVLKQSASKRRIERHNIPRVLRLDIIDAAVNHASLNEHCELIEIEIPPLESHDLACTQAKTTCNKHHCPVGFANHVRQQFMKLLDRDHIWTPCS